MSGSRDEPRLALIVKLARELPAVISNVCNRPRVVLRRVRSMLGVGRVQEVDSSCLRWLARQPGRNLIEKAGPKQRVMAIERVENADTQENRVVRDLLLRGGDECMRYLIEHRRFANHMRVRTVRDFGNELGNLFRTSAVGEARQLVGVPQANYVLQHEPRYKQLWKAYLLLLRQQKQQDQMWRWRHRTWTEVCGWAIWDAVSRLDVEGSMQRSDVLLRDEQVAGQFLDPVSILSECQLKSNTQCRLVVVNSRDLPRYGAPKELIRLRPEFAIHLHDTSTDNHRWIAIWALMERDADWYQFEKALLGLNRSLAELQASRLHVQGLVIRLNLDSPDTPGCLLENGSHCRVVGVSNHVQSDCEFLNATLHSMLELP
jgi:hypothetical protein